MSEMSRRNLPLQVSALFSALTMMLLVWISPVVSAEGQATSRGGERSPYVHFDGVWGTGSGPVILAQDGPAVRGTYNSGLGRIDGTVTDNKLEFIWIELDGSGSEVSRGRGQFELSADHKSFDGLWGSDESDMSNEWDGIFENPREVGGARPELDYCLWRGSWGLPDGAITLKQEMDSSAVEGEFVTRNELASIRGNAVGWKLEFQWTGKAESGTGSLEMKTDMSGFSGNVRSGSEATSAWDGVFHSGELRDDFSGEWKTSIGQMSLTQDAVSGVVRGRITGADSNGNQVDLQIDGAAVGDFCSFDWTQEAGGISSDGSGTLRFLENGTMEGTFWGTGQETSPTEFTARPRKAT
jgi:hypothetical protein